MGNAIGSGESGSACQADSPGALTTLQKIPVIGGLLGGGPSNQQSVNITTLNDSISESLVNVKNSCVSRQTVDQDIEITGSSLSGLDVCSKYGSGAIIAALTSARTKFQTEMVSEYGLFTNANDAADFADADLKRRADAPLVQDIACQSVTVTSVEQNSVLRSDTNCDFEDTIVNDLATELKTSVSQGLSNTEDAFGQIGGLLSGGSKECISDDVENHVKNSFTADDVTTLKNTVASAQLIDIESGSQSVYVNRVKQSTNIKTIASLASRQKLVNKMYTQEEQNAAQNLVNKNDTLGDLASDVSGALIDSANLMSTLVGQMMLIIGLIALAAFILMGALAYFQPEQAKELFGNYTRRT